MRLWSWGCACGLDLAGLECLFVISFAIFHFHLLRRRPWSESLERYETAALELGVRAA
jgi:hypothetical protein